jgi:hypothetical protein
MEAGLSITGFPAYQPARLPGTVTPFEVEETVGPRSSQSERKTPSMVGSTGHQVLRSLQRNYDIVMHHLSPYLKPLALPMYVIGFVLRAIVGGLLFPLRWVPGGPALIALAKLPFNGLMFMARSIDEAAQRRVRSDSIGRWTNTAKIAKSMDWAQTNVKSMSAKRAELAARLTKGDSPALRDQISLFDAVFLPFYQDQIAFETRQNNDVQTLQQLTTQRKQTLQKSEKVRLGKEIQTLKARVKRERINNQIAKLELSLVVHDFEVDHTEMDKDGRAAAFAKRVKIVDEMNAWRKDLERIKSTSKDAIS